MHHHPHLSPTLASPILSRSSSPQTTTYYGQTRLFLTFKAISFIISLIALLPPPNLISTMSPLTLNMIYGFNKANLSCLPLYHLYLNLLWPILLATPLLKQFSYHLNLPLHSFPKQSLSKHSSNLHPLKMT